MVNHISLITGQPYSLPQQAGTWHDNRIFKRALKLSKMFRFELKQTDTEDNLLYAVELLRHMYVDLKMTNSHFVKLFNWHSKFFTGFLEQLGIERRTKKEALKNYARITGTEIPDAKKKYWQACQFTFSVYNYPQILGFDLLQNHEWYHCINNKNGITRDHMFSILDGWLNNVDPEIISHPANCQILLALDNFSKNNSSSITLDDLTKRIESWNNGIIFQHQTIKNKVKRPSPSQSTCLKLRRHNWGKRIYTNGQDNIRVKLGQIPPPGYYQGSTRNEDAAKKRPSKWDVVPWQQVQQDLNENIPLKIIKSRYKITSDALHWARKAGVITLWYESKPLSLKHDWAEIQKRINQGKRIKDIIFEFSITRDQLVYAKSKGLVHW